MISNGKLKTFFVFIKRRVCLMGENENVCFDDDGWGLGNVLNNVWCV